MRAACGGGQAAALFDALSNVGVLPQPVEPLRAAAVRIDAPADESLFARFLPPDAPPPRA
jgi:hypothetical protein